MTKILKKPDGTILIERFKPLRRVEHLIIILGFITLITTGFPQKFYDAPWSTPLLQALGGLDRARYYHRIAGWIFAIQGVLHILAIIIGVATRKMRLVLMPVPQDFRDVWDTISYYLGWRKEHPVYEVFDYRQKFEYLGMVLGGIIMIASGIILIYPVLFATYLPGELIPAARALHSNEAVLALCVLIIWHVYGAHLSPEIFPMDKSIFTGYMTKDELKHHHYLEYRRLFPQEAAEEEAKAAAAAQTSVPKH